MSHNSKQSSHWRAFTITELLIALSILPIFMGAATLVFRTSVLLNQSSEEICNTAAQSDAALHQLRLDVWSCHSISVPNSRNATFDAITWTLNPDNDAVRTEPGGHQMCFPNIAAGWSFSATANSLLISDQHSAPQRFVSQILLSSTAIP